MCTCSKSVLHIRQQIREREQKRLQDKKDRLEEEQANLRLSTEFNQNFFPRGGVAAGGTTPSREQNESSTLPRNMKADQDYTSNVATNSKMKTVPSCPKGRTVLDVGTSGQEEGKNYQPWHKNADDLENKSDEIKNTDLSSGTSKPAAWSIPFPNTSSEKTTSKATYFNKHAEKRRLQEEQRKRNQELAQEKWRQAREEEELRKKSRIRRPTAPQQQQGGAGEMGAAGPAVNKASDTTNLSSTSVSSSASCNELVSSPMKRGLVQQDDPALAITSPKTTPLSCGVGEAKTPRRTDATFNFRRASSTGTSQCQLRVVPAPQECEDRPGRNHEECKNVILSVVPRKGRQLEGQQSPKDHEGGATAAAHEDHYNGTSTSAAVIRVYDHPDLHPQAGVEGHFSSSPSSTVATKEQSDTFQQGTTSAGSKMNPILATGTVAKVDDMKAPVVLRVVSSRTSLLDLEEDEELGAGSEIVNIKMQKQKNNSSSTILMSRSSLGCSSNRNETQQEYEKRGLLRREGNRVVQREDDHVFLSSHRGPGSVRGLETDHCRKRKPRLHEPLSSPDGPERGGPTASTVSKNFHSEMEQDQSRRSRLSLSACTAVSSTTSLHPKARVAPDEVQEVLLLDHQHRQGTAHEVRGPQREAERQSSWTENNYNGNSPQPRLSHDQNLHLLPHRRNTTAQQEEHQHSYLLNQFYVDKAIEKKLQEEKMNTKVHLLEEEVKTLRNSMALASCRPGAVVRDTMMQKEQTSNLMHLNHQHHIAMEKQQAIVPRMQLQHQQALSALSATQSSAGGSSPRGAHFIQVQHHDDPGVVFLDQRSSCPSHDMDMMLRMEQQSQGLLLVPSGGRHYVVSHDNEQQEARTQQLLQRPGHFLEDQLQQQSGNCVTGMMNQDDLLMGSSCAGVQQNQQHEHCTSSSTSNYAFYNNTRVPLREPRTSYSQTSTSTLKTASGYNVLGNSSSTVISNYKYKSSSTGALDGINGNHTGQTQSHPEGRTAGELNSLRVMCSPESSSQLEHQREEGSVDASMLLHRSSSAALQLPTSASNGDEGPATKMLPSHPNDEKRVAGRGVAEKSSSEDSKNPIHRQSRTRNACTFGKIASSPSMESCKNSGALFQEEDEMVADTNEMKLNAASSSSSCPDEQQFSQVPQENTSTSQMDLTSSDVNESTQMLDHSSMLMPQIPAVGELQPSMSELHELELQQHPGAPRAVVFYEDEVSSSDSKNTGIFFSSAGSCDINDCSEQDSQQTRGQLIKQHQNDGGVPHSTSFPRSRSVGATNKLPPSSTLCAGKMLDLPPNSFITPRLVDKRNQASPFLETARCTTTSPSSTTLTSRNNETESRTGTAETAEAANQQHAALIEKLLPKIIQSLNQSGQVVITSTPSPKAAGGTCSSNDPAVDFDISGASCRYSVVGDAQAGTTTLMHCDEKSNLPSQERSGQLPSNESFLAGSTTEESCTASNPDRNKNNMRPLTTSSVIFTGTTVATDSKDNVGALGETATLLDASTRSSGLARRRENKNEIEFDPKPTPRVLFFPENHQQQAQLQQHDGTVENTPGCLPRTTSGISDNFQPPSLDEAHLQQLVTEQVKKMLLAGEVLDQRRGNWDDCDSRSRSCSSPQGNKIHDLINPQDKKAEEQNPSTFTEQKSDLGQWPDPQEGKRSIDEKSSFRVSVAEEDEAGDLQRAGAMMESHDEGKNPLSLGEGKNLNLDRTFTEKNELHHDFALSPTIKASVEVGAMKFNKEQDHQLLAQDDAAWRSPTPPSKNTLEQLHQMDVFTAHEHDEVAAATAGVTTPADPAEMLESTSCGGKGFISPIEVGPRSRSSGWRTSTRSCCTMSRFCLFLFLLGLSMIFYALWSRQQLLAEFGPEGGRGPPRGQRTDWHQLRRNNVKHVDKNSHNETDRARAARPMPIDILARYDLL